jgi:hypothetical protein
MMSDEQGQDADLHMGFDALWGAVVHRTEIDLATLEGPKAAFDHPKTLIGQGGVLDTHGANRQTEARFTLRVCLAKIFMIKSRDDFHFLTLSEADQLCIPVI